MSKVDAALLSALIAAPLVIASWNATLPPLLEVDVPGQENLESARVKRLYSAPVG
jgi:hypothetical protein